MTLQTVRVKLSDGLPLGEAMARLRLWLDDHKIEPTAFRTVGEANTLTFAVSFRCNDDANRFRRRFDIG